ncbi:acetyltransferase (GNAT) family protein [Thermosporothrix hazakensis]|jgi:GNAT superfamily N-acetyltransferase|uniref:Acetyltransferase (GNAT) family protein n=2 Tax=Thermosporothrix TaxID=768650 RepID=A0A326U8P8_THEHA|nr:GNAT family N-acetyltransferase [Thermosporothrix hazakensis]PZW29575.1 acetyltransferase (GNAT) family protein [Thermosporothrix hazakensis]BBH85861.1 N-acetyltransferase [Thermosporothrix sp. COM3]GCE45712.1 N-acetyltransferase [Thermosporothrix hazakensis]
MGISTVEIRFLAEEDLELVTKRFPFGGPAKHAQRLQWQRNDSALYLLAWLEGEPVGHLLIQWHGAQSVPFYTGCPDIEDFFVAYGMRSQGIGSLLLAQAEEQARQRGYSAIGLSVATRNERAQALYKRLGYRQWGPGPYLLKGTYVDALGKRQFWQDECLYLIRTLD